MKTALVMLTAGTALSLFAAAPKQTLVDLRRYAGDAAAKKAAVEKAATPDAKAKAMWDRAHYMYTAAQEGTAEEWNEMKEAAFSLPGVSAAVRLELLKRGVPGRDFARDGFAIVEAEPKLAWRAYYEPLTRPLGMVNRPFDMTGLLDESSSHEYRLALCGKAEKLVPRQEHGLIANRRAELLVRLGRKDEAVALWTANKEYVRLGDFYTAEAERFFGEPDRGTLEKALAAYGQALAGCKAAPTLKRAAEAAWLLRDAGRTAKLVDDYVAGQKDAKPDAWAAELYGHIAYEKGDWETAVKWYTMFPLKPTPVYQRHKLPDASQMLAGALYALGRYEECLQATKTFPNFGSHRDENEVLRQAVKAKIR